MSTGLNHCLVVGVVAEMVVDVVVVGVVEMMIVVGMILNLQMPINMVTQPPSFDKIVIKNFENS